MGLLNRFPGAARAAVLITCITCLAYANSFRAPFVLDDVSGIVENPSIRRLLPLSRLLHPPESIASRPVTNFTLAVNYAISGMNEWSYHALNLFIHICAALTLFGIVGRTLAWKGRFEHRNSLSLPLALSCGLIWAVHPLQTQAVTYTIQRCEALMGLCVLAALYGAIRGWQSNSARRWHLFAVAACLVGSGAKEAIVIVPFLVLAYDRLFVHRTIREALVRSRLLYMGLVASIIPLGTFIFFWGEKSGGTAGLPFTPVEYLINQPRIVFHYIHLAFWPASLSLDYSWYPLGLKENLPYLIAMVPLLLLVVRLIQRRHPLAYPALWFFGCLAPTSSLFPVKDIVFEHRMYLPLAGLVVIVVFAVFHTGGWVFTRLGEHYKRYQRAIATSCLVMVSIGLTGLTLLRNHDYRSEISIWEDTIRKHPENHRAQSNLGNALSKQGRYEDAIKRFEAALRIRPQHAQAFVGIGLALIKTGNVDGGIGMLTEAVKLSPYDEKARNNLGFNLILAGKFDVGIGHLLEAIRLNPAYADAHYNLGLAYFQKKQMDKALTHYLEALRLAPDDPVIHTNAALVFHAKGNVRESIHHLKRALEIRPDLDRPRINLQIISESAKRQHEIGKPM